MQKLDFTENINSLVSSLNSKKIIDAVKALPPNQAMPQVDQLTPLIIESKSNYDKIDSESGKMDILKALDAESLYSQTNIANIINAIVAIQIQHQHKVQLFLSEMFLPFYSFHENLLKTQSLAQTVLFKNNLTDLNSQDTIIFRILSGENIEINKYVKIISLIKEIIEILKTIFAQEDTEVTLTLIDSGSDSNLGVKSTIEISRSLFQIFKEVWDWIVNRKFYKNKLRNSGLMDSLNIMTAIHEAKEKSVIDEETARIYKESIIIKTEDLLDLNVLPKDLFQSTLATNSRKLLSEFSNIKLLENKNPHEN
jgi:hypothetical protein